MLAIGFVAQAFARADGLRLGGGALLGLGLLFLGIHFMGDATRPLRTFQPFIDAMQDMRSPWVGVLAGALFTAVVQSSAATLAIIIALGSQGLMPLEAGIALILGANVGTCGTALLAAIGKPAEALQVGIVHLLFNVFGVLMFVFIIPSFAELVRAVSPSAPELDGVARLAAETPRQVANAHTIFSVASTLVLIWFTEPLARLAKWMAPAKPTAPDTSAPRFLDEGALKVPALAMGARTPRTGTVRCSGLGLGAYERQCGCCRHSNACLRGPGSRASATPAGEQKRCAEFQACQRHDRPFRGARALCARNR
jgi:phosphate:Na+ symporter